MDSFVIIPDNILSNKDISPSAKLLAGVIISLQSSKGYCFASNSYLADRIGMSAVRTRTIITELAESGLLQREISLGDRNEFSERRLVIKTDVTPLLENEHTPCSDTSIPLLENEHTPCSNTSTIIYKDNKKNNSKSNESKILKDSKFEEFWELYGKKTGKKVSKSHWDNIKDSEIDSILEATKRYVLLRPDAIYRKDPERFLKHKIYDEDFLKDQRPTNQTTTIANNDKSFEAQIPNEWL
jgi:hypothetical protein